MTTFRCFGTGDPAMEAYHDQEWGRPQHNELRLFEHLVLEGFQSGLSWSTVLHKRARFRAVFADFDPEPISRFEDDDVARLLADPGIVRNRRKIEATIHNARALVALHRAGGTLDEVTWRHRATAGRPRPVTWADVPTTSPESVALAKELKKLGFRFVGPTTMYAHLQAVGVIDDHLAGCLVVPMVA
ncbi:MAG: DNA-3-methyladenine glycosylase I [Micrococcales bacterium]|nr:DNA-3-methyladenine glycosylase I [Micrococcales bacterium]